MAFELCCMHKLLPCADIGVADSTGLARQGRLRRHLNVAFFRPLRCNHSLLTTDGIHRAIVQFMMKPMQAGVLSWLLG